MRKILRWDKKGAIGIVWSLIAMAIHSVMVSLGYIDGISELVVKYSNLEVGNVKYILTAVSFFTIISCISLLLSIAILWVVKKVAGMLPSNQLKDMHETIKIICDQYSLIAEEESSGVTSISGLNISRSILYERTEVVIEGLVDICKIKKPREGDQIIFLEFISTPVYHGDIERVRQISKEWDKKYADKIRAFDRRRLW